jgi:hypothetical protein
MNPFSIQTGVDMLKKSALMALVIMGLASGFFAQANTTKKDLPQDGKAPAAQEEIKFTSYWEGTLNSPTDGEILILIKIYTKPDGTLGGFSDWPTYKKFNTPLSSVVLTEAELRFVIPQARDLTFEGRIDKATMTAKGNIYQDGGEQPFEMKKVDKPTDKK